MLGDLGLCQLFQSKKDHFKKEKGTPYYYSPEIWFEGKFGTKTDVWAMGCMALYLLTGDYMIKFNAAEGMTKDKYKDIFRQGIVQLNQVPRVSLELVHFVDLCLTWDEAKRPTASSLLKHPFLTSRASAQPLTIIETPLDLTFDFRRQNALTTMLINLQN